MKINKSKLLAISLATSILFVNFQEIISYANIIETNKESNIEYETNISTIKDSKQNITLGEKTSYVGKSKSINKKPYITRISKSEISIGNYYQATINIYGQAKYGTTVYAKIGYQEASQKIGVDQTFGFTIDTRSKNLTIEFYSVNSNGIKSESVFVTCTPNGDSISNNGTYPTNSKPLIQSNDKVFDLGANITDVDLLKDVTAYDEEDGDITSKIVIKEHNINSNVEGIYRVVYKVTDNDGETTEKENKVEIVDRSENKEFLYEINKNSVKIKGYLGNQNNIVIPDRIEGYPVTSIDSKAFRDNKNVVSITLAKGITDINSYTFSGCSNLTTVNLPAGLINIGGSTFEECNKLKNINIPDKVKKIGVYAFYKCTSLEEIELHDNIEEIGYSAFGGCESLKNINIPKKVSILQNYIFNDCTSLTEIKIPEGVNTIEYGAFLGCANLKEVIVPKSVINLEENIFAGCSKDLKIYGYKGSSIEKYAKGLGLNFEYINTPPVINSENKIFNIGSNISDTELLKDVTAYDEEDGDITGKIVIKEHNINNNQEGTYRVVYKVTDSGGLITEKENTVEIINPNIDKEFSYTISEGSVTIDKYIGNNTDVVIPEKIKGYPVKNIAYGSFRDNKTIVSVTIPKGITQLNGYTFSGCSNLTTVKLPDSLIYIHDNAFEDCTKLKNINIPNKVKLINVYAFKGCSSLESLELPNSIEEIGYSVFSDCIKLKNINIPKNIKTIQNYAFSNCQSLTEVEIPEGVNTIEYGAFYGCTNLKKVVVPKSVIYLEQNIFTGCSRELKIHGYKGSYIEKYANNYGLNFVCIRETNTLPKINAKDITITVGQSINLMEGVSATDQEEGNITSKIKIVENTVNIKKSGIYKVVYQVEDCDGNQVRKEIKVTIKPKAVFNVVAKSNSYSSNKITWDSLSNVDGYEVYRATSKTGTYSLRKTIASDSPLTYTNTSLTTGRTYYYKVRAYKEVNGEKIYGDFSGVVSAKPQLSTTTAKASSASSASYSSNKVTWNKVSGASGYEIYRATSSKGTYSLKKTVTSGSTLSYTNTGLTTGKKYYYKVRAYRLVNGKKVYGNFSSIVSSSPKLSTPSATLSAGTKKAYVKWGKVSGASGYEIYRSTKKTGTYSRVKSITSGSTTSYTNSGLTSKKGYYYKVKAYRTVNGKKVYSSYSSVKYIKVK